MGPCHSSRAELENDFALDKPYGYTTDECRSDDSTIFAGEATDDSVIFGSEMTSLSAIDITWLASCSDRAITLSKPLFASTTGSFSKSRESFFQRTSKRSSIPLTEVHSQLFFGSWEDANNDEKLHGLGITHIISLIGQKHSIKGIKHRHTPMNDHGQTDLNHMIDDLWSFILESQEPGNKLFLHCHRGQNRSPTVVLAIMMKLKIEPHELGELHLILKKKRPVVQINQKYAKQLSKMESELFGGTTVPKDWMKIVSYDMDTGNVVFHGEGEQTVPKRRFSRLGYPTTPQCNGVLDLSAMQYGYGNYGQGESPSIAV